MQQLLPRKEENVPDQQECLSVDLEDIKQEEEKLWTSEDGRPEGSDVTKFRFIGVPVKTENDEKPESSRVHQCPTDESREAEPVASSSMLTEDCGGPQPARNSGPLGRLHPAADGRISDSSETDTEGNQTRELCSHLNFMINSDISASDGINNITGKQFSNSECGKAGGSTNCLKQCKMIQATEKPCSCPACGKRFREQDNLAKHIRIHTGEKPYGCSECGKRFGEKNKLNRHMRNHTVEKLYLCSECGKTFGQKSSLNTHMIIHTGEKPFGCSECGKRFGLKSNMKTHMRIHTGQKPFGCSECDKRFGDKSSLYKHIRIHTGEKPFGCSKCGERFGRKSHLIRHMRIHAGEKPFGW
ncbi:gastrula zinc finger protein XlCGF8.2DB-like [Thalassophryne amazonica]|uniref:gastrula zinc finger protein XlCGF8.2DB-like n=1 Tax=Thalassophryne amazonica TaxID=390379 RepID=UPI001470CB2F|nr:gastrula zinc finger protein XlCGF8.2DB-like [Thalassophryne amazonica]